MIENNIAGGDKTVSGSPVDRRNALKIGFGAAAAGLLAARSATAGGEAPQERPTAAAQTNELAPENQALAQRTGLWDVIETSWPAPGAAPVTTTGLVAERRKIGAILQEILRPAADIAGQDIKRIDYLTFNHLSGQWEYLSMDTRVDIALMPARSFTRADADGKIVLVHDPFVVPGAGKNTMSLMRMNSVVSHQGPDRDMKEQHFVASDGTGTVWLAHRYAYTRRP